MPRSMLLGFRWQSLSAVFVMAGVSALFVEARLGARPRLGPVRAPVEMTAALAAPPLEPPPLPAEASACELRRQRLSATRALPGAPGLEAVRAEVVARARAAPVLFT